MKKYAPAGWYYRIAILLEDSEIGVKTQHSITHAPVRFSVGFRSISVQVCLIEKQNIIVLDNDSHLTTQPNLRHYESSLYTHIV